MLAPIPCRVFSLLALVFCLPAVAFEPEVTNLVFDRTIEQPAGLKAAEAPEWITKVEQQGGEFRNEPKCWEVLPSQPEGVGRMTISLDRERIKSNLAATVLFDGGDTADIAVQLLDAQNRVVVVDLFGSLVDVGREATTDTFIVPLKKYPTAEKLVLRRINGNVKIYGIALFPVVTEGEAIPEAMEALARSLGDPLSPENPLVKGLETIARKGNVALAARSNPSKAPKPEEKPESTGPAVRIKYTGAMAPSKNATAPEIPTKGLMAHWTFDDGSAADITGSQPQARLRGSPEFTGGIHGGALRLDRKKQQAAIVRPIIGAREWKDQVTIAGWINYGSIAPKWGSQIFWLGDEQLGRDPLVLHLFTDGTLEFRSDRSITGPKPTFVVYDSEVYLSEKGEPVQSQHVATQSPGTLLPRQWYFVTATMEKVSPRVRIMSLYINGERVNQLRTEEVVNYSTDKMWVTLGGVDAGTWQNFDGLLDDIRVYDRPLSQAEIQALYRQPWR